MSLQVPRSAGEPADAVSRQIDDLAPWFHNLHLPSGHRTAAGHPLGDFPAFKWEQIAGAVGDDLRGVRALDIGCNAGFYSFELAARGAQVLAIDVDEHYLRQGRWAARQLDPDGRVRFERLHLYDLIASDARFDLILFLGVLYHLRYPQLALDLLARLVGGRMIVQTLTMPGGGSAEVPEDLPFEERARLAQPGWPKAAFIERSYAGDTTNWWAPDDACVRAMLRSAGLRVVGTPAHETYLCERERDDDPAGPLRHAELNAAMLRRGGSADRRPPYSSHRK
ncbi:MAG TPA: TIGR04290 family methyltransferase [Solirubrobacteraceae bacterium]|jgi:tRNA (mo5U34)-methyltransferase|nr:TIGR04290 family methyltransferase [Solirubrobacteraceae bacterium]